jgi:hypothetical protein
MICWTLILTSAIGDTPIWPSLAVLGIMIILRMKLRQHWAASRWNDDGFD